MPAYSPTALQNLFNQLKSGSGGYPTATFAGIYANKPGYHNARNNLGPGDYSVQRVDDRLGDGWAASALDITLNPADMKRLTQRLIDLTRVRNAPIQVLREFFGTVDGRTVTGLDVRDVRWITSDDSHLWHVHLSSYRRYANDIAAMNAVAAAILGGAAPGPTPPQPPTGDWFDMATEADLKRVVNQELRAYFASQEGQDRIMVAARTAALRQEVKDARVVDANAAVRQVLASQEGQDRMMVAARTAALRPEVREAQVEDCVTALEQQ